MWAALMMGLSTTVPGEMRLASDFVWVVLWLGFDCLLAKSMAFNMKVLGQQVAAVATSFTNVEITPAHRKLRLFKDLESCLCYYPLIVFTVCIGLSQLPLMLTNLAPVALEVLFLGLWVRLGFILRCRPVRPVIFALQPPSVIAVAPVPPSDAAITLIRGPTNTMSLGTSIRTIGNTPQDAGLSVHDDASEK
ncbi:hypothetical protein SDRG_16753 [Saprolegnia diclina VS20]|uniref:Uncharacterized protein n=1 Tax=Saprolegnia diclina (strain VS20) TaxID=1156394 RepID=T0PWI4_SAPDV|nr:hypothetical protein SDRG_16753 [Saprolegnia diclina VS20]EQC25390.1 hypothetical protein SDRG_16753 [Saprolegnia diclina VS20]|eukprot:XP_008621192.1 hypothetical protein SDRG_16753 [Saprolegnia diclina VS20]